MEAKFKTHPRDCREHSFHDLVRFTNGRSAWGDKICQKCGAIHSWQYDYNTDQSAVATEARAY